MGERLTAEGRRLLRRRRDGWTVAFTTLGLAGIATFLVLPTGAPGQGVIYFGLNLVAALLVVWAQASGRLSLSGGGFLLAGVVLYTVANVPWTLGGLGVTPPLPYPSVVDAAFLLSYGAFGAFILVEALNRRTEPDDAIGLTLEAVIVAVAAGLLVQDLLIRPVLEAAAGVTDLAVAASVTYPAVMIALLALVLQLVARSRANLSDSLLLVWIGGELAADLWFAKDSVAGTFVFGQPSFVLWLASYLGLGLFVIRATHGRSAPSPTGYVLPPRARLALLTAALAVPASQLVSVQLGSRQGLISSLAFIIMVALVLARVFVLLKRVATEIELRQEVERLVHDLEFGARHDRLTNLGNRVTFDEALARAAARRSRGQPAVLLFLDLDHFKAINDALGHAAGDAVLQATAQRLTATVRASDTVARLGGDEFGIIAEGLEIQPALRMADRLAEALSAPLSVGPVTTSVGVSIGVYPLEAGDTAEVAVRRADASMYVAKSSSGGVQLFDDRAHGSFIQRHELLLEFRAAIRDGQLLLNYQTIIELAGRTTVGTEALVRWQHPTRGLLMPGAFIDMAEESGAVVELGRFVLERACQDAAAWQSADAGLQGVGVSVNVSRRQLRGGSIVDVVEGVLRTSGLKPELLTLEVTETALMNDTAEMIHILDRLHALGVKLSMDDFGTGYSSLSQLRRLPIDVLKIDRAFVSGIAREEEEWSLAVAIVRLAASLGRTIVAEGVEEPAQMVHLRSLGVEFAQGYLFSRPVALEDFLARERAERTPLGRSAQLGQSSLES